MMEFERAFNRNRISSLTSLVVDYVVRNFFTHFSKNLKALELLPNPIKNSILLKLTRRPLYRATNMKNVLAALLQSTTKTVDFTPFDIDDEFIKLLEVCSDIRQMVLTTIKTDSITTNALLSLLKQTHKLSFFELTNCDAFTDEVLECLATNCPKITGLSIGCCQNITDEGMRSLTAMKHLTWITLSSTNISDKGISILVEGGNGEKIKELRIDCCVNITDEGLILVAKNCLNLEVLTYHHCSITTSSTAELLEKIEDCKALKQLVWTVPW